MRIYLLVLAWLAAIACAAGLQVPGGLEADDGAFVSVPVVITGEVSEIRVTPPPGFKLLSKPAAHPGKSLVNFFIDRGLASGDYQIEFYLIRADGDTERAQTTVFVRPRVGFAVEMPPGKEILLGGEAQYRIGLINSGNVPDEVTIEVRVPENDVVVEPERVRLPAGERGGLLLTVHPRSAQPFVVILLLRSQRDPQFKKYVSLRTDVLPFAGAGALRGRSLRYRTELKGSTGSEGWGYGVHASIAGGLSDYVRGVLSVSYAPGRPRGGVFLNGDWGEVGLEAASGYYAARAASGAWRGGLRYDTSGMLNGQIGWSPGVWRFSLSGSAARQRFTVGATLPVVRWLRVEPSLFVDRYGGWQADQLDPGGELRLKYDSPDWLFSARVGYRSGLVSAGGEFARRRSEDYNLRGYWFYSGGSLGMHLEAGEALGETYRLGQSLNYLHGDLGWRVGLHYAADGVPWSFGLGAAGSNLIPGGYARLAYKQPDWQTGAGVSWSPYAGWRYSLRASYKQKGTSLSTAFSYGSSPRLSLGMRHDWRGWSVTASYDLDLSTALGGGRAEIGYDSGSWLLSSGVSGDSARFKWWLSGGMRLEGGLATPEAVVQLFGGRETGRISGLVYVDANENAVRDEGEKLLARAYVSCGSARAESGADGRYQLEAEPGDCQLSVQDAAGRYGLPQETTLRFERNGDQRRDLGLVPVAGVTGVVWLDADQNGARDEGEHVLAGAVVMLQGPGGFTAKTFSDASGRFSISYLPPGEYRLRLAGGLPRLAQPAPPLKIRLEPGPLPFVGVRALPKELRRVQTFSLADASMSVQLGRQSAPPGAELPITVTVSKASPTRVFLRTPQGEFPLKERNEGVYEGYLIVPENAAGAFFYRVIAETAAGEVYQEAMLLVRPGRLATLAVRPAFAAPGEELLFTARFLKRVAEPYLLIGGVKTPLQRQGEFTYAAHLAAPQKPGRYVVELYVEGKKWAETAFRVSQ